MEVTRISAIRHGETAWNLHARLQGHLDIPLNDNGREQARLMAQAMCAGGDALAAIYSSDLSRARDTAQALAACSGLPVQTTANLRERCFAELQGRTFAEVQASHPEWADAWRRRVPDWTPAGAGGESLLAFRDRVLRQVQALCAAHVGGHIAIVTHGGVLDVLYRAATGLGLQDARTWSLENAAINRLLWTPEGGLSLVGWADVQHLNALAGDERLV